MDFVMRPLSHSPFTALWSIFRLVDAFTFEHLVIGIYFEISGIPLDSEKGLYEKL